MSPEPLKKGDKIAICSTARKISAVELEPAVRQLEAWGLEVVLGEKVFGSHHQFAGLDADRLTDFQQKLDDKNIRAILCSRGGYGTVRIIDQIDFDNFRSEPKWIIGYSDITVLHCHIHAHFDTETIHGTMAINFAENSLEALESLRKALFGEPVGYELPNTNTLNRPGSSKGQLVGGNLSILYSLIGTPSDIDTKGKILFVEDVDEYLYHIDRMMITIKRAGKLGEINGLIVGGMTEMNDHSPPTGPFGKTAEEIVWEHVQEFHYPVCFGFPAGHFADNRALLMGSNAELSIEDKVTLHFS